MSTSTLNPYLTFNGDCREAMTFYQSVLGGELTISTFGDYGSTETPNPDGVMHAHLAVGDTIVLMASDNMPGAPDVAGNNISVSLSGTDETELSGWFTGLAAGGSVTMPLETQVWGDTFGMLTDRFGVAWMVNIGKAEG